MGNVLKESSELIPRTLGEIVGVDLDALSLTITSNDRLTSDQEIEVKKILQFFGTKNSDISLATSTGPASKDGIFGTPGKGTIHLEKEFREKESIIISTPVKLATLNECVDDIVDEISPTFCMRPSKTKGLCFDSNIATNLPTYGDLTEALVKKSYHGTGKNKFFLHVANLGKRSHIVADIGNEGVMVKYDEASLWHLFELIQKARNSGVTVSVLQLDIAFKSKPTLDSRPTEINNSFANMSIDKIVNHGEAMFGKCDVFPTEHFDIEKNDKDLRGTVRLGHNLWGKMKNFDSVVDDNSNSGWDLECDTDGPLQFLSRILTSNQSEIQQGETSGEENDGPFSAPDEHHRGYPRVEQGRDGYAVSRFSIFSLKVYNQTAVHALLQERKITGPLKNYWAEMNHTPDYRIDKLKILLKRVHESFSRALESTGKVGPVMRTEISVRPVVGSILRKHGHLVDLLLHVYLGIWSLSHQWKIKLHLHDVNLVQLNLAILTKQLWGVLCCRGSLCFAEQYRGKKYHDWLKFMLATILIVAGYAPAYKIKYQRSWFRMHEQDNLFFDPYDLVHKLNYSNFLSPEPCPEDTDGPVQLTPPANLVSVLCERGRISEDGARTVADYVEGCFKTKTASRRMASALDCFTNLAFRDKLNVIVLLDNIIAGMSDCDEADGVEGEEQEEEEHFVGDIYNDSRAYEQPPDNTNDGNELNLSSTQSPQEEIFALSELVLGSTPNTDEDPRDPTVRTFQYLRLLPNLVVSDQRAKLFKFIERCHEKSITLPGQDRPLQPLEQAVKVMLNQLSLNAETWRKLSRKLGVHSIGGTKEDMTKALCQRYYFPHQNINVNQEITNELNDMNDILNTILSEVVVRAKQSRNSYSRTLYRSGLGSREITIINWEKLLEGRGMDTINYACRPERYNFIPVMIGLGFTGDDLSTRQSSGFVGTLVEALNSLEGFQHMMMYSDGQLLDEFKNVESAQSLFDNTLISAEMNPRVVLPIVSLLHERDILLYDLIHDKTLLYVSQDTRTVVVYKMNGIGFRPRIKTIIFSLERADNLDSTRLITHDDALPTYKTLVAKLATNRINVQGLQGVKYQAALHASRIGKKVGRGKQTFFNAAWKAFQRFLPVQDMQNENTIDQEHATDEMTLNEYISELTHRLSYTTEEQNQAKEQLFENFPNCFTFPTTRDVHQEPHINLAPFLCLKYKITIVVWIMQGRSFEKTELIYYDMDAKKVKYKVFEKNKIVFPPRAWICYFSCSDNDVATYGYYDTFNGNMNSCIDHLHTPYSFPQDSFVNWFAEKISGSCGIKFTDGTVPLDKLRMLQSQEEKTPIILLRKIYKQSALQNQNRQFFVGWFVLCIYEYESDSGKRNIQATYFSEDVKRYVTLAAETFIRDIFDQGADFQNEHFSMNQSRTCNLELIEFQRPLDSHNKCSCNSGFYALMTAYIASISYSPIQFKARMQSLCRETGSLLESRLKVWLSRSAMSIEDLDSPFWMRPKLLTSHDPR